MIPISYLAYSVNILVCLLITYFGWCLLIVNNPRLLCMSFHLHSSVAAELTVSLEEQVYEVGEVDTSRHLAVLICAQTGGAEIERFSTSFVTLSTGNGTAIGKYRLLCKLLFKMLYSQEKNFFI